MSDRLRCARLKKECVQSPRKRAPKPLSKTAQLEQKVDDLLSLLKTSAPMTANESENAPILRSASAMNSNISPGLESTPTELPQGTGEADGLGHEDQLLNSFRVKKLPYFPFVLIPDDVSAQDLKKNSPYLWRCIEITESGCFDSTGDLITYLRRKLSNALLVELENSLDLLHAILVYLAW